MAISLNKSNKAHERLARVYELKRKNIESKGNNDSLSDKQLKQKKLYALKVTYHTNVLSRQRRKNKVLKNNEKKDIYKNIYDYLF